MAQSENNGKRWRQYRDAVLKESGYDPVNHPKQTDRLKFAPDWYDNLARRIATGAPVEAVMDWLVFRANGNQCLDAVHVYARNGGECRQTFLGQRQCALEIAWLRAGHPWEWLDAPLEMFRAEAARRGVEPIDKSLISQACAFNRRRGTMASNVGHRLTLNPSPKVEDVTESRNKPFRINNPKNPEFQAFLEWYKVEHVAEFAEWEVVNASYKRIFKVVSASYKKYRKLKASQTNRAPFYNPISFRENTPPPPPHDSDTVGPAAAASAAPNGTAPEKPPQKAEEEDLASCKHFKSRYPKGHFDEAETKIVFHALKKTERIAANRGLSKYLDSEKWKADSGRWIPLSSNWLRKRKWESDPEPYIQTSGRNGSGMDETLEALARMKASI